jgi:hypothetical protein
MRDTRFTDADIAYIKTNYVTLGDLCAGRGESPAAVEGLIAEGRLPKASYVLPDGTGMFPRDYFRLVDEAGGVEALPRHFADRYRDARQRELERQEELDADWQAYLAGIYGMCLRELTPETIVRKAALVSSLAETLMLPAPHSDEWRQRLREQVGALDALEREFTPDYDRSDARERPPTRDLLVAEARRRYPDAFDGRDDNARQRPVNEQREQERHDERS